ncbi:MAG: hypothetical protein QOK33_4119 [Mycobacterium sp.]|jgi:hypothetical protein|nr:hypothetical protein [Mycobacterium sp.]
MQRNIPQPFGIGRIECVRRNTGDAELVAAVHDLGLVAVLEILAADTIQQWGRGKQHGCGGPLLDGLEPTPRPAEPLVGAWQALPR